MLNDLRHAIRSQRAHGLLSESAGVVFAGLASGLPASIFAGRLISSLVFGITPNAPITFAGVCGLLLVSAGAATLVPSLQAARTNPARVIRAE